MSAIKENERLEFFSDGIFAIAITLLVLEIKVPNAESVHSVHEFWIALSKLWPNLFAVVLSFIIILLGWLSHHGIFKLLDKSSLHLMFANGFYLLTIVLFPFASALVAEYLDTEYATPAVVIYCAFNLLQSTGYALLLYSTFKPKLLIRDEHSQKQMRTKIHGPRLAIPIVLGSSEDEWKQLLDKTYAEVENFACMIDQLPESKLWETFVDEKYGNYYRNLHGIIEHCHYHLGQIVLIKRMVQNGG